MSLVLKQIPIEKEYEKNPDVTPEDIRKLREWLKTQPHLPEEYLDDITLMLVFHCCNSSQEVSKQVLDLHLTLRTLFTNYFKNWEISSNVELCLDTIVYAPLPTPTVNGYRAIYLTLADSDPRKFFFPDALRTFMMVFDLWQYEEGTWPGFVIIIDFQPITLAHIGKLEVSTIRDLLYFLQECMLVKLKEIHFMNAASLVDKLMILLKPFLKKELLEMLKIHQANTDTLYKYISKEALPKNAGGTYKNFADIQEEIRKRLRANEDLIKKDNLRRVDESLRPGGKSKLTDQFGTQGSFKKLDLD